MYKRFESRESFSYNIQSLDRLIQTPYMPNSFVLYQEHVMRVLNYAGIEMAECYAAIKNISKKRAEKVLKLKQLFLDGFSRKLQDVEHMSKGKADETALTVWKIVEDNSNYSFNASHAYCVALDSLYCAWLKAHYPVHFYGVYMRLMSESSGKKDKVQSAQAEAESYFRIKFPPFRFGQDNSIIAVDVPNKSIYKPLNTIKGFSKSIGAVLAEVKDTHYEYFSDLLMDIRPRKATETVTKLLTKIDYFQQFGNQYEVFRIIDMVELFEYGNRHTMRLAQIEKTPWADIIKKYSTNIGKNGNKLKTYTIQDCIGIIHEAEKNILSLGLPDIDIKVKLQNQIDILGYISTQTQKEEDRKLLVILDCRALIDKDSKSPWGYAIETQSLGSGKHGRMTIRSVDFDKQPLKKQDIIYADNVFRNKKGYWYLNKYSIRG